jgi:hypothetical protein
VVWQSPAPPDLGVLQHPPFKPLPAEEEGNKKGAALQRLF